MRVPAPILVALGLAGSVSAYAAPQGLVTVLHAEGATPESSLTLRCLSPELVDGLASQVKGARIRQYDCGTPGLAPNWKIQRHGMRGFYELRNDATGLCMDSTAPHPGAPIVQWPCHGGENQAWRLLPYLKAGAATRFLIQRPYFLRTLCLKGDRDELNPFRGGAPSAHCPATATATATPSAAAR